MHCTATAQTATVENIQKYWREVLGWQQPGYHFIVKPNGEIAYLLDISLVSNGVKGFNSQTINISYIGGVDFKNNPKDTRTPEQKATLLKLLREMKTKFPKAVIQGHKDFPNVHKACPSFEAKTEYKNL